MAFLSRRKVDKENGSNSFHEWLSKKKKKKQLSWVRIDSHNLKKDPRWVFYLINNILSFVLVLYN